jgi:hypothetical protein
MRDLRDGEHEDEVVEQLEIGGVLLLVAAAKVSAHRGATLAIRAAGPAFAVSEDFGGWGRAGAGGRRLKGRRVDPAFPLDK